ncbi:MAG: hypothetical protein AB7G28_03615 [Pirellulales bacterium]
MRQIVLRDDVSSLRAKGVDDCDTGATAAPFRCKRCVDIAQALNATGKTLR